MPVVLLFGGFVLLASAVAGTTADLTRLLRGDFTGPRSFLYWLLAIGIVGCVGYVPGLDKISKAFLALILLSMFLANGSGVITQVNQAIVAPPAPAPTVDRETGSAPAASAPAAKSGGLFGGLGSLFGL